MYCWNCGKEMDDELLHCPHCGMKQAGVPEPKAKRPIPVLPIVCAAVCLAALMGMVLLFALPGLQQTAEPVDPQSVVLPDMAAFLNTRYTNDDTSQYTHHMTCVLKSTPGLAAAEEYLQLLQKALYQLTLDESRDTLESDAVCTDYIFHYTGQNDSIRWVPHNAGYQYHVKLSVYTYSKRDTITLILYTAPGFELEDPGVTAKAIQ